MKDITFIFFLRLKFTQFLLKLGIIFPKMEWKFFLIICLIENFKQKDFYFHSKHSPYPFFYLNIYTHWHLYDSSSLTNIWPIDYGFKIKSHRSCESIISQVTFNAKKHNTKLKRYKVESDKCLSFSKFHQTFYFQNLDRRQMKYSTIFTKQ